MTEVKKTKKVTPKKAVAKRSLCTSKGMVNRGEEFTCTADEYKLFKSVGAI